MLGPRAARAARGDAAPGRLRQSCFLPIPPPAVHRSPRGCRSLHGQGGHLRLVCWSTVEFHGIRADSLRKTHHCRQFKIWGTTGTVSVHTYWKDSFLLLGLNGTRDSASLSETEDPLVQVNKIPDSGNRPAEAPMYVLGRRPCAPGYSPPMALSHTDLQRQCRRPRC